jgi:RNA polymerase sigma-70 factor (ECF subfamily)
MSSGLSSIHGVRTQHLQREAEAARGASRSAFMPTLFLPPCNIQPPGASWLTEAGKVTIASANIDELPILMTSRTPVPGVARLYERHYETVFRVALRVTGNPADAEDVLQTVFVRVLARGGEVEDVALPAAYFRRAAVNAAVDVLRRRELRAESAPDDRALPAVQPPLLLKEQLRRAIAALDSEVASLFLLRHVEGLSIEELAGMFEMEKNNVTVRLHRIRQRLQVEMQR